ncbi:metal ABC transporter solute-binding protein, Zn/Mn family [Nocardiopsis mangrovi]|uniref:Metal ABC transporter solute-binding protein, Zn/Mn family n=1 Tax=Nocardiopsis mangrovi TaxID=1179818 RepID=A0ABV9DP14_9ACTN
MRSGTSVKVAALCAAGVAVLAGCGGGAGAGGGGGAVDVVTGVYPLEWLAGQVGGEHVEVTNLTEPGAEPHDLELTPRQIGSVASADVVFFIHGLQPAVDDAAEQEGGENALDVADTVDLRPAADAGGDDAHAEDGHSDDHADEEADGDGHDHGDADADPHMWLDTDRMAQAAAGLAERLGEADPDNAGDYTANAERVADELADIGTAYTEGLAECESRDMVVAHSAFGYLADAYDLHQIGVSGIDPEAEPSPARLAEVAGLVEEHGITTVFTETLTSPRVAETIAAETGAETAVLDPLEGITDRSPGDDYPSVMRANLDALTGALRCS